MTARTTGGVLEPNRTDDAIVPAYRCGQQGPGAERAQDLMELGGSAIASGIRDVDLIPRQQVGENPRQLVVVQLQSLDVPAGLAIEAVFATQDPRAVPESPDTGAPGARDIGQGLCQRPRRQRLGWIEHTRIRCQGRKGFALPRDRGLAIEQQPRTPIGA